MLSAVLPVTRVPLLAQYAKILCDVKKVCYFPLAVLHIVLGVLPTTREREWSTRILVRDYMYVTNSDHIL